MARESKKDAKDKEPVVDTRGQISVPLGGQDFILRPSYKAIVAIERQLYPRTLYELSTHALQGRLSIEDMAIMVVEMMKAYGEANPEDPLITTYLHSNLETIGKLIMEAGSPSILARLAVILVGAVTGGYDASGEVKTPGK